jgi:selT/selW/selH-like putative selenoprotein
VRNVILGQQPLAKVTLRKSSGGVFEITVDGRLVFSKKATHQFPSDEAVIRALG